MSDIVEPKSARWTELWRYYQAIVVNTAFGFGLYWFLIYVGVNIYVAQAISYCAGVTFNYFTYSRHVFRDGRRAKVRYVAAYGVSYLVNLALLGFFNLFIHNEYLIVIPVSVTASIINYFVLKHLVFVRETVR